MIWAYGVSKSNKKGERTLKIYLTGKKLKDMEACKEARWSFRSIFGEKATIKQVLRRLQNPGKRDKYTLRYKGWLGWLMAQTLELTTAFLEAGADVHAEDDYALRCATDSDYAEIVKILLEAGADVHALDDHALCCAAQNGYTEVVKILLEAGANVHVRNNFSFQYAELNRHTETVKVLKAAMKKK